MKTIKPPRGEPKDAADFRHRIRNDFGHFIKALWADRQLMKKAPLSDIELDIVDFAANGSTNPLRGVLGPRGLGKTHLGPASLSLFRLLRDPDRKIIIPSKGHPHAKKVIGIQREWINDVWFLRHLSPKPGQRDAADSFQVGAAANSLQPSVSAIGIDGQLEGNRGHSIFPDDVETEKNTLTLDTRESLRERVGEFVDICYPNIGYQTGETADPSEVVYFGTYHHEESLYIHLAAHGFVFRTWTILAPHHEDKILNLAPIIQQKIDSGELKPSSAPELFDGDLVFAHRFGPEDVARKKAQGRTRFAMQHMLISNLSATNRYPLRLSDLIVADVNRDMAPLSYGYGKENSSGSTVVKDVPCLGLGSDRLHGPIFIDNTVLPYTGTRARVDPAGVGDDMTGLAIVGHLGGFFHVKYCRGLPGGVGQDRLDQIASLLRLHAARECEIETNNDVYDTYFPSLELAVRRHFLEPGQNPAFPDGWKCSLIRVRAVGQKELRIISALEPAFSTHRVVFDRATLIPDPDEEVHQTLQYQLTRITKQRKCLKEDGAADALAGAIAGFAHTLAVDHDKRREVEEVAQIDRTGKFLHELAGASRSEPSFLKPPRGK